MNETITQLLVQVLQNTADDICDKFCKYQNTVDAEGECEWVRNGGECPLDKII